MLHMATSYLSAGYQELRNLCGTSKVALQQGVIVSTNRTIYGMFTEGLGINMLQKKRCLVLRHWASCCKANHPAWKAACHIHTPHTLLAAGASETSRKQEQVMLQIMINYVEDQPSKLHPPAFPVSLLLFLPRYFPGMGLFARQPSGGHEGAHTGTCHRVLPLRRDDGHGQVHPLCLKKQLAAGKQELQPSSCPPFKPSQHRATS